MIEPLEILAKAATRELGPERERLSKAGWTTDLIVEADEERAGEATVSLVISLKALVPVEAVRDTT